MNAHEGHKAAAGDHFQALHADIRMSAEPLQDLQNAYRCLFASLLGNWSKALFLTKGSETTKTEMTEEASLV
jgi:hypothetical protein